MAKRVNLETAAGDEVRREVQGFRIVAHGIAEGCVAAYFPEASPLVPLWHHRGQELHAGLQGDPGSRQKGLKAAKETFLGSQASVLCFHGTLSQTVKATYANSTLERMKKSPVRVQYAEFKARPSSPRMRGSI